MSMIKIQFAMRKIFFKLFQVIVEVGTLLSTFVTKMSLFFLTTFTSAVDKCEMCWLRITIKMKGVFMSFRQSIIIMVSTFFQALGFISIRISVRASSFFFGASNSILVIGLGDLTKKQFGVADST